jgi:hypothetical protein
MNRYNLKQCDREHDADGNECDAEMVEAQWGEWCKWGDYENEMIDKLEHIQETLAEVLRGAGVPPR